ncbi:hypothetical protein ACLS0F_10755 [Avibacterium endocarditidis]|uniref:Uncharacterized protein n=1 Tax=Avibacterium endocarditidis TaxID=380674 RepID=A0ABX4ZVH5_9PAST|nr:hypothetical protein [Avibacterium endocarditidis]POY43190.1 hypothetical protein C3Z13_00475 [Avibacterium endocarditidis]
MTYDKFFVIWAYLILFIIVYVISLSEKRKNNAFYVKAKSLLDKNKLTLYSITALSNQIKIKRFQVVNQLTKLYLDELENDDDNAKRVEDLLKDYQKEFNFSELPSYIMDKINLLKTNDNAENIRQLAEIINTLFISEKRYKLGSLLLAIFGIILSIISILPVFPTVINYLNEIIK